MIQVLLKRECVEDSMLNEKQKHLSIIPYEMKDPIWEFLDP